MYRFGVRDSAVCAFRHETAYRIFLRESDYDKKIHFNRVHYMDHCGAICL